MVEGINMASFLKQMEELEKLKKKAQVAPKLQTHKGVSSGTPSSLPRAIDNLPKANASQKAGMAAEKATRVFLQNSPDAYLPRPQQVGPSQWKGPTNTKNIGSIPGMSAAKRAASAAERASMAYQNAFLPTPKKQNTYGPQKWNGGAEELSAYNPFKKGPSVFETAMNNAKNMEQPATPTEARSGGGLFNRVYNAASSIGDSMIGADKSLKATAKQAFNNEKEYRKTLAELDSDINAYMAERDKYAPGSKEYKAINTVINNLYNAIDDLRNKAADMTDANEFMRSAEKLRNEATKGLSGLGLDLAEAGISMADNLTTMALTGFNPTATLALMGAKSAGQRANQLSNQGVSARDALGRGVISGVIEGLTEKIGLDNLFGLVKSNNIKALSSILKQAAAEGGEEGLSNILNYAVDWASGDRKDFDWDDFARSVRQGALSGLGFGIGGVASNTVLPRATGYSDMGHLNMERAIDGKRYGEILPRAVKKYSSDVSGVNVNIGSETAQNYINRIQKPINANEINSSIKIDMSEAEREPILKNMSIKVSDATRKAVPAEITDKINSEKLNEAYKAIKAFAKSLGVFKQYENENIDIKFNFSGESYNKSKSEHMIRKNNVNDFLLMVNDFDNIIQNAIPIEIHSDRINGGALKNVRVLVSAFWNGKEVVPVEIEVKEYNQQENEPKLYMAVTINKKGNAVFAGSSLQSMHALALPYGDTVFVGSPKMGPQTLASPSESDAVMDNSTKIAPLAVSSPFTISLPDLIKGVNGNNGDFLKYFPDSMLDDEQIAYKNAALEKERVKYENKNKKSDSLPVNGLQLSEMEATSDPIFNIPQSFENNKFADANTSFYKSEVGEQAKQENEKIYHGVIKARTDIFTRGILDNFNKARKFFIDYAKNNFKPQYINKETGKSIDVGRNGLDKVLSGNITYEKYASVFHIPELIENATYIGKADNYHTERPDRQNSVKTYSYYESPISIDGKMYIAYIRVRNTLMGDKYYGHTIGEILDRIKIEPLETRAFAEKSEIQSVNEVSSDSKNIIPQTSENINNSAPKELGERQVMPEAVPKTSTVPDNALGIVPPEVQELFELKAQAEEESKRLYQNTVNGLAPFDRMAKADTRDNRRNISALSNKYGQKGGMLDTILTSGLYDINGNKVDDRSWVSIVSQVPKEQIGDFNTYLQELHNIDRQAQGKPVTEHTADESRKIVADLNVKYPEFKKYQKEVNDYLDKFFYLYYVDAGMMTEQAYREIRKKYPNYIPSFRVGEDNGGGGMKPKKKIKNSTGIGKAVGGTSEVMSFDEAVAKKMNTVMSAAVKNDISREVFAFAEALPSEAAKNGVLIQNDNNGKPFDIDDVDRELIRKIDKGNYSVTFYNNGKPQTMKISKDVYEAYEFLEDKIGNSAIRWAANLGNKLTSPMKALTTQYNPLFALTNIIRDAQTYTINNTATKPLQAQKNYVKAIAGIIRRSDAYNQYKALGGSQNGYFGKNIYEQAESRVNPKAVKGKRKAIEVLKTPLTAVEKMGEFTEKIPRFAEYLNTVENLGDTDAGRLQASLNAADVTVNFNRSSTLSTLANAWVPYFNAGLQGADKTFRQIKAHPFKTTARATVSVFLPTLLLYLVNKDNPHWKDVKDGVRDGYYLIPNVLGPNSGGYAETFIRVPKSREFGALLSASFERFIRAVDEAVENDKDMKETLPTAFDGYMQTFLNSFMPPDILGDNILGSIARLNTNTAWHGGKIVPSTMENVSPRNQYDINTSQLAMNIAEKANKVPFLPDAFKSPMKVDYLIDSYGGYAGDLLQGLTSRKNIGEDNMGTVLNSLYNGFVQPAKQRFTTDSAYSSYNLEKFYNRINELDKAANDRDIDEGLPTEYRTPEEKVLSDFTKARSDIADITKQERAVLERAIPISEKNKEIRQLKQEKNRIAKDILQREDELYKGYTENYIPKLSGLTDDRQEAAKQLYNDYGLTYDEYLDMYDKYKEINDMDVNKRLKATYFEDYLESLGYTDQYNIKPELQDEFSYWNMTPATSYYGSKDYQKVNGILPVETYADLSSIVNGLESNVDYPKGKRSPYVKSLIDRYLEKYGYNPTYGERMKIYDSMGVAKGYRY